MLGLLLAGSISSCWVLMPNCHKRFTTYRYPIQGPSDKNQLRANGFYYSTEEHDAFFLTPSGLIKMVPFRIPLKASKVDSSGVLEDIIGWSRFTGKNYWGEYRINNDSIQLQWFNYHQTEVCKRSVFDDRGIVLNDTTFVITSRIAYWFDDTATTGQFVYRFYRTDFKPDDSRIWFEKKRWYLNGRDKSRVR